MKIIILFMMFFSSVIAQINIEKNESFSDIEKEYIKTNTVTIGMIEDYYPFAFKNNGKPNGYSYDYLNLIIKKSGLKIDIKMDTWSNILKKFKNKELNLIDTISYKKDRESFTNFTEPYFQIANVIFARKGEFLDYENFESLKGMKIGITKDIYYYDTVKDLNLFELVTYKNSKENMKALAFGDVDAAFNNHMSGQRYVSEAGYTNIKILDELNSNTIKKEDLRIGVEKENDILYSIINKSIKLISRKELEKLNNKWFSTRIIPDNQVNDIGLTKEEKKYLDEKEFINMCIDPHWMPFEKLDEKGNHIGITADYYKVFSKMINQNIRVIKTTSWNQSIEYAKSRKCDILSLAMQTPERKQYMDFTTPYLKIPIVIATKLDVPFIDNIASLKNKSVGIPKGYAFVELLKKKYKNINIIEVDDIKDGLKKVNQGELYGYIGTLASISYQFQNGLGTALKITGKFDEKWELAIAVRNDDKILFNILEKLVEKMDVLEHQRILSNWISIKYEKEINYTIIIYILVAVFVIALLFLYRQYSLKKSNRDLKIAVEKKTKDLQALNESLESRIKEEVEKNLDIQEKLFKSEKMASMGEMIGNIAHQWRQPLSMISMGATGMQLQKSHGLLSDEFFEQTCIDINENAQYLSKTIDDFRNFILGDRTKVVFTLSNEINRFLSLVKGSITNNNINMIVNIEKELELFGYPNELLQCVINIFNNSRDILLEREIKNKYIFITSYTENNNIIIKIKDNARGINKDILPKVFDLYFTTKHQSKGTGIGLHMTYNLIVKGMNGSIEVHNAKYTYENNEYSGAEFVIKIPKET